MFPRKAVGDLLKGERKRRGKTQKNAAIESGLDQSILSKIENGRFLGALRIYENHIDYLGFEIAIQPKVQRLPCFEEIDNLFKEE